jgi:integrase
MHPRGPSPRAISSARGPGRLKNPTTKLLAEGLTALTEALRELDAKLENVERQMRSVAECQKADETFPTITPHDLRHTAASLAVSAGANVKAVQRMLGHAKASMTLDVYADLFDDDLDSVADNLDAAIRSAADQLRTGSKS